MFKMTLLLFVVCGYLLQEISSELECRPGFFQCITTDMCKQLHAQANSTEFLQSKLTFPCDTNKMCCPPLPMLSSNVTKIKPPCSSSHQCISQSDCVQTHKRASSRALDSYLLFKCEEDKICCPPPPTFSMESIKENKNMKYLPKECEIRSDEKRGEIAESIINGKRSAFGKYPWMALIGIQERNDTNISFYCDGSLITNKFVLTAVHCRYRTHDTIVRLGEYNTSTDPDCDPDRPNYCAHRVLDVPVRRRIPHKSFCSKTLANDIALLLLKNEVTFTTFIRPICLPFFITDTGAEERDYIVAGWGKTINTERTTGSNVLQIAKTYGIDTKDCKSLISSLDQNSTSQESDELIICTEDHINMAVACQGDSGGPLIARAMNDKRPYIIGIVSHSVRQGCSASGNPTVHVRVHAYIQWIMDRLHL